MQCAYSVTILDLICIYYCENKIKFFLPGDEENREEGEISEGDENADKNGSEAAHEAV